MRRRRLSRVRTPHYWSRACFQTSGERIGPDDLDTCDESEVACGVVLFDPIAAQLNNTEARVTVKKIYWPIAVAINQVQVTTPAGWLWCAVVKTGLPDLSTDLVGLPLGDILGGGGTAPLDILDFRVWGFSGTFSGGTNMLFQGGPGTYTHVQRPFELNVMRKLDEGERIVAAFGLHPTPSTSLGSGLGWQVFISGVASVLWQNTLR